jgi:group I intron endonuclease
MNRKYTVYCHTNKINGKKYVGITGNKPEYRWKNGLGYQNHPHFFAAIKKYGWHNFWHEALYTGLTKAEAEEWETKLIKEYNSSDRNFGYNKTLGGDSNFSMSEEVRAKMGKSRIGKKMPPELVEKNRISHLGQPAWNKGKPWSDEMKAKCGGKSVTCVETGKVYRTAHEAAKENGLDFSSVCKCCRGKSNTCGGYHWKWTEEDAV